jgi:prepilin-type processing-associated H-X9-DG protein
MRAWYVVGLIAGLFAGIAPAAAQPPQKSDISGPTSGPIPAELSEERMGEIFSGHDPYEVVFQFVGHGSIGNSRWAAFLLSGVDWKSATIEKLGNVVKGTPPINWRVDAIPDKPFLKVLPVGATPETAKEVTIAVNVGVLDGIGVELSHEEQVTLRREPTKGGPVWRIVPEVREQGAWGARFGQTTKGVISQFASYYSMTDSDFQKMALGFSLSQAKQIGLGTMQFLEDYDQEFKLDAASFKEKMTPYVSRESLFTAPGDNPGEQSYRFNRNLFGKKVAELERRNEIVAIYLVSPNQARRKDAGPEEELAFRYAGKAVVCFADGHVEAVDAERAKTLRWTIQ